MHQHTRPTIEEMRCFALGSSSLKLSFANKNEAYDWLVSLLKQVGYKQLAKADKGLVRAYAGAMTGYQPAQITRLIRQYRRTGKIVRLPSSRHVFAHRYTSEDIVALAEIDNAHDRLSGAATLQLCLRAFVKFGDERYERLCGISVAHIYNLRIHKTYDRVAMTFTRTQSTTVPIGERRKTPARWQARLHTGGHCPSRRSG